MSTRRTYPYTQGSNFEMAYASPAEQHPEEKSTQLKQKKKVAGIFFSGTDWVLGDGRKRRYRGSSDDWNGNVIKEKHLFKEDLRVGGPCLCEIPVESIELQSNHALHYNSPRARALRPRITTILQNYKVSMITVSFVERLPVFNDNPGPGPILTLLVLANRIFGEKTWLDCVWDLRLLFIREKLHHVSVEIVDPRALRPPATLPVLRTDPIFNEWNSVLNTIMHTINLRDIEAVGCFRRGRIDGRHLTDSPTVLIIVDVQSSQDWRPTREQVVNILNRRGLSMVAVEIVKDRIDQTCQPLKRGVRAELLSGRPLPGQSVSLHGADGTGSLGGFVEVLHRRTMTADVYAMTCFHCLDPDDREIPAAHIDYFQKWRKEGVHLNDPDARRILVVDHPSEGARLSQTIQSQSEIDQIQHSPLWRVGDQKSQNGNLSDMPHAEREAYKLMETRRTRHADSMAQMGEFFESSRHRLGFVKAASGYKLKKIYTLQPGVAPEFPTAIDWALIQISAPGREPIENVLNDQYYLGPHAPAEILEQLHGQPVSIDGWASGRSVGFYSHLKICKRVGRPGSQKSFSLEHVIVGNATAFATSGDSGSLVFTGPEHYVVGMHVASQRVNPISIFIRIDDLFDDIKAHIDAKEIRMYHS
ncbi:uncharacterized protein N7459_005760 [Penicillium hispanicum]|uniref:uncharacterized protein n=1 Tax=Penicillium hispanicum TaxID=1080232 RepID=UPI00254130C6|nr:uncharacterized protein N7459_005760 [Penicillium hispanicum]KAJ5579775.1 hypothetical protein N7459_005760 [Penicillium hispanicum]